MDNINGNTKMQAFIGSKIILATPMSKRELAHHKGNEWSGEEDEAGYLVQYAGKENYQSWSPKAVFEEAYRPISSEEVRIINI